MNELVDTLSSGDHPVVMARCKDVQALQAMLERGYALIKFTDTKGGTEVGFEIDKSRSILEADFDTPKGRIHLQGDFVLNYEPVRLIAYINIKTRKGKAYLRPLVGEQHDAA